ncbi:hypothetical protein ACFW1A_00770 [Kitasatospora sp. NPDC058965]|uniref:hypothetical protein n=1 Tax=Kitasatospora sp. NPDC058965 TaxID=3346682 RepID=UPI00369681CB
MNQHLNAQTPGRPGTGPAVGRPGLILPPGYVTGIDPDTGQVVAVPTREPAAPDPDAGALARAQYYAALDPGPLEAVPPPPVQGLDPRTWQFAALAGVSSLSLLAAGGAVYLVCAGLHLAGPWLQDAAVLVGCVAGLLGVVALSTLGVARKLKTQPAAATDGSGQPVVNALLYRRVEVNIGEQKGGFFKGSVNNHVS